MTLLVFIYLDLIVDWQMHWREDNKNVLRVLNLTVCTYCICCHCSDCRIRASQRHL